MTDLTVVGRAVAEAGEAAEEQYNALADECKAILVERGFNARQEVILSRFEVGEAIVKSPWYQRHGAGNAAAFARLEIDTGLSARNLHYCVQFAAQYPTFKTSGPAASLSQGKELTWTDIRESLPEGADPPAAKEKKPRLDKLAVAELSHSRVGHVWTLADHNTVKEKLVL